MSALILGVADNSGVLLYFFFFFVYNAKSELWLFVPFSVAARNSRYLMRILPPGHKLSTPVPAYFRLTSC